MTPLQQSPDLPRQLLTQASKELSMDVVQSSDFDDELLQPLHALSNAMMAEPYDHFRVHAFTNDVLHVFRQGDEVVGFQFWRTVAGPEPDMRVVLGGKLRIAPRARRQGLHLVAGLSVLLDEQRQHPQSRISRIGVASIFGFSSIAKRLAHFDFVRRGGPREDLINVVHELTRVSHFDYDPAQGTVDVGIFMTREQLEAYPAAFYEQPLPTLYAKHNPDFRSNGKYLAFAFDLTTANFRALTQGACRAVLRDEARADAWLKRLEDS